MPTLLQINVTANSGSHGKIAEDIGRLATLKGWRSIIAYGRWANPSQSELIRIGSDFSVYEHGFESLLFDNQGLASRTATKRFIDQIETIKPSIVHLHNIHGYYLNYRLLFENLAKQSVPVVWTLHDCWSFTGHCSHFDYDGCELWKTGCHAPCINKVRYPKTLGLDRCEKNWMLKKHCFSLVKNMKIVTVSDWLGELVKQSYLGHYPVRVIHNGIDIDLFNPVHDRDAVRERYGIKGKKVILGVANVWEERKGLADFGKLRESLSDEYDIVLVGVNDKQKKSLPKGIVGISRTQDQHELAQLYSVADVFVNPTYEDNYPTTNLEAMACGTPVLTYETGGSPEAIDKNTGWVVTKGDISSVVRIIHAVDKRSMTLACRHRAESFFDKNKCFDDYLRLYNSALSR